MRPILAVVLFALASVAGASEGVLLDPQQDAAVSPFPDEVVTGVYAIAIPRMLTYQGKLTDTMGIPVPDTTYSVAFRLYTQPTGGAAIWNETQVVRTEQGLFSILLGAVTPIGSVPDAGNLYFGMAVEGGTEMTPRLRIVSAAYAYKADSSGYASAAAPVGAAGGDLAGSYPDPSIDVDAVTTSKILDLAVTDTKLANGAVTSAKLSQMGAATGQVLKWTGSAWQPRNDSVGGGGGGGTVTSVSQATGVVCTPNPITVTGTVGFDQSWGDSRYVNESQAAGGDLAGSYPNPVVDGLQGRGVAPTPPTTGQVLKWNGVNWLPGNDSVGSGDDAWVRGGDSVLYTIHKLGIARGGAGNGILGNLPQTQLNLGATACTTGTAGQDISYATVVGGGYNRATATGTFIGGGGDNRASGLHSVVAGGEHNAVTGNWGAVLGGDNNTVSGVRAVVAGGAYNTAAGAGSVVPGGEGNLASAYFSTASGFADTALAYAGGVLSGWFNYAGDAVRDTAAVVCGGGSNVANAKYACVGGGAGNEARGAYGGVLAGYGNSAGDAPEDTGAVVSGGYLNHADGHYSIVAGGQSNNATGNCAVVCGGAHNVSNSVYTMVGGGAYDTASAPNATVGGGFGNSASGVCAAIAGGASNHAEGSYSTIAGGQRNLTGGGYATVGGGEKDTARAYGAGVLSGSHNVAGDAESDSFATVAGGRNNTATDMGAFVGGGEHNHATGSQSVVAGGFANSAAGALGAVAGGTGNAAGGSYSFVGGGYQSIANGLRSVVCGGYQCFSTLDHSFVGGGYADSATGLNAVVAGGERNSATASYTAVGGGRLNFARGQYAAVPGGGNNVAGGYASCASGYYARANHDGGFVWSDRASSAAESVYTTANNQWRARARGGVWFFTNAGMTTGSYLSAGGSSWNSVSDSMTKENFRPVDKRALLEALARMRVRDYNLKSQSPSVRHIGPVAQDFHNAFGFGESNTAINMEDADGVLLAAVQALYEQNQVQQAEIEALKTELKRR